MMIFPLQLEYYMKNSVQRTKKFFKCFIFNFSHQVSSQESQIITENKWENAKSDKKFQKYSSSCFFGIAPSVAFLRSIESHLKQKLFFQFN